MITKFKIFEEHYYDEYNKIIVYDKNDYKISVDSIDDCKYIALWYNGKKVGEMFLTKGRNTNLKDYMTVSSIKIQPKHRGKGLSKEMYKAGLKYSNKKYKGIGGEYEQRYNKKQVSKIYKSLGGKEHDNGDFYLDRINESYKSQKALEELTEQIIEKIIDKTYKLKLNMFSSVYLYEINNTNPELKDFLNEYSNLQVCFTEDSTYDDKSREKGAYLKTNDDVFIYIYYNNFKQFDLSKKTMAHYYMDNIFGDTLIHELQHAYDDFRSKGKAITYLDKDEKLEELKNKKLHDLKYEEYTYMYNKHKDYLIQKDEIDARFTQTVKKMSFFDLDDNMHKMNIYKFDKVLKQFKDLFYGYEHLDKENKERLFKKLGQYYQYEKEYIQYMNGK